LTPPVLSTNALPNTAVPGGRPDSKPVENVPAAADGTVREEVEETMPARQPTRENKRDAFIVQ
jgi:hypothetical protein